ncbi:MAG: VWA domain-containing protein [Proteobacteria bacterium]|nr:VWA domain-containing protein [Pseudomonadota bacterium]MBU4469640.1 VWA domain-containing protein [Pseudomonadota bacterium]MCG2751723.1 VWA domain-containing protein [Desulfobacteraceae bacterium]
MFRFTNPYFLFLLALIPLALYFRKQRRLEPVMGVSVLFSGMKIHGSWILNLLWVIPALQYTALGLMIVGLARPQWGVQNIILKTEGINIILAVDLSESMAALDFKQKGKIVNRLEAVKGVVNDFIAKRSGDRIGMVVFGSEAYTQLPLTRDYDTITTILNRLEIGAAGKSTAIGDALGIAVKRIEDVKSKENIIILLTDGRSNSGELKPEVAADIAAAKKVKVYTVGVGSYGKAPFLVQHPVWGDQYVYQNVDIDEDTLKQVASKTEGRYFRAQDTEKLNEIYDTIDQLEKTETKEKIHAQYRDLYFYPLMAALVLVSMRIVLSNTRFLRVP